MSSSFHYKADSWDLVDMRNKVIDYVKVSGRPDSILLDTDIYTAYVALCKRLDSKTPVRTFRGIPIQSYE